MAAQGFLARVAGKTKQLFGIQTSAGSGDAGKLIAAGDDGKLDESFLPTGIGANSVVAPATEAFSAGNFVNLWDQGGTIGARLADNSNNRPAHGYVKEVVSSGSNATVYRLNTINAELSGLVAGSEYWLGVAGAVMVTPLDPLVDTGKTDQYLGIASSDTELVTCEFEAILL
ncbi:MAG: hypothetical protein ACOH2R_08615 [Pseudomonas sp.]